MQTRKKLTIIIFCMIAVLLIAGVVVVVGRNASSGKQSTSSSEATETTAKSDHSKKADVKSALSEFASTSQSSEDSSAKEAQVNAPAWTTNRVNMREGASPDAKIISTLSPNTKVTDVSEQDGWAKINWSDKEGYIKLEYLTKEEPASAASAADQAEKNEDAAPKKAVSTGGHVVVIDPGHQAHGDSKQEANGPGSSTMKARVTGGTRGTTTGVYEYQLTLAIAQKLKQELQNRGYTVYMTRESHNVDISNKERAQYATSVGADIAVRIHANGSESSSSHGALALVPSSSNRYISSLAGASRSLGSNVLNSYCAATGMSNLGVQSNDTMTGMNWSTVPVTILEMGFMTNPTDDRNMEDATYQSKMVNGIADGIDQYFAGGK